MPTGSYIRKPLPALIEAGRRRKISDTRKQRITEGRIVNKGGHVIGKKCPWAKNNLQIFKKGHTPWSKGKKFSEAYRRKISDSHKGIRPPRCPRELLCRGSRHPWWKGGVSPINELIRKSPEYKLWREAVFARDDYTCVWCGARSGNGVAVILHADHIKPFALFPELRFTIDNGRTLCEDCHRKTDTYGGNSIE